MATHALVFVVFVCGGREGGKGREAFDSVLLAFMCMFTCSLPSYSHAHPHSHFLFLTIIPIPIPILIHIPNFGHNTITNLPISRAVCNSSTNNLSSAVFLASYGVEYYASCFEHEKKYQITGKGYIDRQKGLTESMRGILVDWLVELTEEYR